MRKTFLVLALIFCGLWAAPEATAGPVYCAAVSGNLVTNCGFETGDFTGWTVGGNSLNPGSNYFGVDAFDANSGNYGAYMSQDFIDGGTTPVTLSQTLATVAGGAYAVTFWLEQDTAPTPGYAHVFSAAFGGTTLLTLTPTVVSPGPVGVFTQYTIDVMATTSSSVLKFSFENDDQYWSFDDVSVSTVPEPSTGMLAGLAIGGLLLLRRKTVMSWK